MSRTPRRSRQPPRGYASSYPGHSGYPRKAFDLYCEPGWAVDRMLDQLVFEGPVLDPCAGTGTIVSRCRARGLDACGSDIQDFDSCTVRDVFSITERVANVISNPPFILAEAILRHLLTIVDGKIILFLRLTFIEANCRDALFAQFPPALILAHRQRVSCPPGTLQAPRDQYGAIIQPPGKGGKMPYGWFCWWNGQCADTVIRRI
jgi:hypothetical protein